jgi:general secretion pathway protein G
MRNRVRKAFTLVEILIVVVILGILAAIVVPQFTNATQDAQGGNIQTQLDTIQNQIELWKARKGSYPTIAELNTDSTNVAFVGKGWGPFIDGGYLKSPPANPTLQGNQACQVIDVADATHGWTYDVLTGTIGATFFDEIHGVVTPGVP